MQSKDTDKRCTNYVSCLFAFMGPSLFGGELTVEISSQSSNIHYLNPVIYSHSWSFLPGEGHSKHTLKVCSCLRSYFVSIPTYHKRFYCKAGRQIFPFQHELSAALPASADVHQLGASVQYQLRATAIRSAFAANFHATRSFALIKAFSPESIEYNQSPEIEVCLCIFSSPQLFIRD